MSRTELQAAPRLFGPCGRTLRGAALAGALAGGLESAACTSAPRPAVYERETFSTQSPYSRSFPVAATTVCDAARRALLSQGYVVKPGAADVVDGRKSFQPDDNTHVQIEFHVVCAPNVAESGGSTAFVNAVQDRYALKKTSTSASVGVGPIGSISVPFSSSDDSLVKVASETIPAGRFYGAFFELVEQFLAERPDAEAPR